jgi:hypothetical protein
MTESDSKLNETTRRSFLRGITATPAVALASGSTLLAQASSGPEAQSARPAQNLPAAKSKVFVGMQIGASEVQYRFIRV